MDFDRLIESASNIVRLSCQVIVKQRVNQHNYDNTLRAMSRAENALLGLLHSPAPTSSLPPTLEETTVDKVTTDLYTLYATAPTTPRQMFGELVSSETGPHESAGQNLKNLELAAQKTIACRQALYAVLSDVLSSEKTGPGYTQPNNLADRQYAKEHFVRTSLRNMPQGSLTTAETHRILRYLTRWVIGVNADEGEKCLKHSRFLFNSPSRYEQFRTVATAAIEQQLAESAQECDNPSAQQDQEPSIQAQPERSVRPRERGEDVEWWG